MRSTRVPLAIGAVIAAAVAGCVPPPEYHERLIAESRPPTRAERAQIIEYVRNTYKDPYSIKDAEISNYVVGDNGQGVCVWANAKNSYGAYTGRKLTSFWFGDGKLTGSLEGDFGCHRMQALGIPFRPFPELERLD